MDLRHSSVSEATGTTTDQSSPKDYSLIHIIHHQNVLANCTSPSLGYLLSTRYHKESKHANDDILDNRIVVHDYSNSPDMRKKSNCPAHDLAFI